MDVLEAIKSRRSVREYAGKEVGADLIREVLEAARWAPSGKNNQPWKFTPVTDKKLKEALAEHTQYGGIIKKAMTVIAVFLDETESYNRTKDVQAIGACIQNMLLAAHGLGLGAVWLGEILNQRHKVEELLKAPESFELMACVALGYPKKKGSGPGRKSVAELTHAVE